MFKKCLDYVKNNLHMNTNVVPISGWWDHVDVGCNKTGNTFYIYTVPSPRNRTHIGTEPLRKLEIFNTDTSVTLHFWSW